MRFLGGCRSDVVFCSIESCWQKLTILCLNFWNTSFHGFLLYYIKKKIIIINLINVIFLKNVINVIFLLFEDASSNKASLVLPVN